MNFVIYKNYLLLLIIRDYVWSNNTNIKSRSAIRDYQDERLINSCG